MEEHCRKRVWLYGRHQIDIVTSLGRQMALGNVILGCSRLAPDCIFPLAGLVPAMQAAIREELDELIISDIGLLDGDTQVQMITEAFTSYGVVVRSASSNGSSNS